MEIPILIRNFEIPKADLACDVDFDDAFRLHMDPEENNCEEFEAIAPPRP